MKLSPVPTLTLLVALASAQQENPTNAAICAGKNAGAMQAIGTFCAKTNIVVPSTYAAGTTKGAWQFSRDNHTQIWINGSACKRETYVRNPLKVLCITHL